jgi:tetrapyrrole methylase family protein/MazG family protein/ATP diphosphatase
MNIAALLELVSRLRDPASGCPWDRAQTHRSLAPYALEEAYEVVAAIEQDDSAALCDELGDLLFQIVLHAQLAAEEQRFAFGDVVATIHDKMRRRHPHVFGGAASGSAEQHRQEWEAFKARERADRGVAAGALANVPLALPALTRAVKLGRRAAGVGFDWPDLGGVRAKLTEELAELDAAVELGDRSQMEAELGDVLFSLVNLARHLRIDPEAALRGTNARFEKRFGHVEARLSELGLTAAAAGVDRLNELWDEAKRRP